MNVRAGLPAQVGSLGLAVLLLFAPSCLQAQRPVTLRDALAAALAAPRMAVAVAELLAEAIPADEALMAYIRSFDLPARDGDSVFRAALAERDSLGRIAVRLARALHLRVRARGTIGTGDPADAAALVALRGALGALPGVELALGVDWVEEAFDLDLELAARIWIAELLVIAAAVLLARRDRRALRAAFGRLRT